MFENLRITIVFFSSLFLLVLSAVLGLLAPGTVRWSLLTVVIAAVGASVFFPLIVGYFYDQLKAEKESEIIGRIFTEFSRAGILRIYGDREESEAEQNAVTDLRRAFLEHREGRVRFVGVSLRVFFNQTGPFYESIVGICSLQGSGERPVIQALVSNPDSPEAANRGRIETPETLGRPFIKRDIDLTIASINNLKQRWGDSAIDYRQYSSAPYCTTVLFPHRCYFSPNILSKEVPVRLPMVVFNATSHAYKMLDRYFDLLWNEQRQPATPTRNVDEDYRTGGSR